MSETPYPKTANEPKVHPMIRWSFAFVPTAGMRLAPEVLVLELMREIFFKTHYGDITGTRTLNAEETDDERPSLLYQRRAGSSPRPERATEAEQKFTRGSFFCPRLSPACETRMAGKETRASSKQLSSRRSHSPVSLAQG